MAKELAQLLEQAISGGKLQAGEISAGLEAARERIYRQFDDGVSVEELIHEASAQIDRVLEVCFSHFIEPGANTVAGCSQLVAMAAPSYCRDRTST